MFGNQRGGAILGAAAVSCAIGVAAVAGDSGNLKLSPASGTANGTVYAQVEILTGAQRSSAQALRAPGSQTLGTGDAFRCVLAALWSVQGSGLSGECAPGSLLVNGALAHGANGLDRKALSAAPGSAVRFSYDARSALDLGEPLGTLSADGSVAGGGGVRVTAAADGTAHVQTLSGSTAGLRYTPSGSPLVFTGPVLQDAYCGQVCCAASSRNCGSWCDPTGACALAGAIIGPAGGSVTVTDPASPIYGASVVVPPNALAVQTQITIGPGNGIVPIPLELFGHAGPVVDLQPDGQTFAVPVEVTMPYAVSAPRPDLLTIFVISQTTGVLSPLPTVRVDTARHLVTASTTHFTFGGGIL